MQSRCKRARGQRGNAGSHSAPVVFVFRGPPRRVVAPEFRATPVDDSPLAAEESELSIRIADYSSRFHRVLLLFPGQRLGNGSSGLFGGALIVILLKSDDWRSFPGGEFSRLMLFLEDHLGFVLPVYIVFRYIFFGVVPFNNYWLLRLSPRVRCKF